MIRTWNRNSIIGFTDVETVKLDFDNTPFSQVKYWAEKVLNKFDLEGFIILKSSEESYHVVFNRKVEWAENMQILAWVSLLSHNEGLSKYLQMQCIKKSSTLRVSPKREKPSPIVVYRFGKQDSEIKQFLKFRTITKRICQKLTESI